MNYQRIYDAIVERAKSRGLNKKLLKGYFEKHPWNFGIQCSDDTREKIGKSNKGKIRDSMCLEK
jgi:hypothetical protein